MPLTTLPYREGEKPPKATSLASENTTVWVTNGGLISRNRATRQLALGSSATFPHYKEDQMKLAAVAEHLSG